MSTDKPVTMLHPTDEPTVEFRYGGWYSTWRAECADGTSHIITRADRIKRDALARIARGAHAPARPLAVTFADDGRVVGTVESFSVFGG